MEFARGDADFCAHAELAAIGELGGGVVHEDGAVQLVEEAFDRGWVLGEDGVCVVGAEF